MPNSSIVLRLEALEPCKTPTKIQVFDERGINLVKKKKEGIAAAITERLLDRKGSAIRKQMMHRPAELASEGSTGVLVPLSSSTD